MDPASAAVAFVGFTASLATITSLVVDSSKTLYNLRRSLENAPEDIERLSRQLRDYEALLSEVQHRLRDNRDEQGKTSGLETLLTQVGEQMNEDMRSFATVIGRVEGLLGGRATTTSIRRLTLRIRHILQEDAVREYQRLISSHIGTLTLVFMILNNRKLDTSSNHAAQLSATSNTRFEFVSTALANLHSSQNVQYELHRSALDNINGRLQRMEGQLGFGAVYVSSRSRQGGARNSASVKHCGATVVGRAWRISLPFWKVVTTYNSAPVKKGSRNRHARRIITFIPPSWLSRIVLQWEFRTRGTMNGGLPRVALSLTPISYNSNPEFKAAITNFDIAELRRLFLEGIARPTDYVLLRKPMPLLEAFAARVGKPNGRHEALDMYKFLLNECCGNDDPMLASLHSRVLIHFAKRSQQQLRESIDAFLSHGGSMFWRHSSQGTIMSLIMRNGARFDCIHDYLFCQPEPWTIDELSPIDRWLIGVLAHTNGRFRRALRSYFSSYKSPFYSKIPRQPDVIFDINTIVAEVQGASSRDRIQFLEIVSKWGTGAMLAPFLGAGLDINETTSNEFAPWLRLNYLSKAVRWGNSDTFRTLLNAGAAPTLALLYVSRHPAALPPTRYPTSRKEMVLALAERAEPEHLVQREEMLSLLLRSDDVRGYSSAVADKLIDRFFLKPNNVFIPEAPGLLNSYILIAIILDLPAILQSSFDCGFCISENQRVGKLHDGRRVIIKGDIVGRFTWLTFAINFGRAACVKILLDNGANVTDPDPCGRTALQMAEDYVAGPHPRTAIALSIWPYQPQPRYVSAQDDDETLAALRLALNTQRDTLSQGPQNGENNRANDLGPRDSMPPQIFGALPRYQYQIKHRTAFPDPVNFV